MLMYMKKRTTSKTKWFIAVRGSYLPVRWQGWLLHLAFILYVTASAVIIAQHNSSIPFIAVQVFAQLIAAAVIETWIAARSS